MTPIFVGLGSNLGDRNARLQEAVKELASFFDDIEISFFYETEPMYVVDQPPFLNGMIRCSTSLGPLEVLKILKDIERKVGRLPRERFGPREIDLDLICYGSLRYQFTDPNSVTGSLNLEIPHPRLAERRFVLQPLSDLDSNLRLPGIGSIRELLNATKDQENSVIKMSNAFLSI